MTDLLRWQFDLTWSLARIHLDDLTADDALWEPGPLIWTVRQDAAGVWRPDWAETEPDPIPVPTIGWLTWHIDWWWSGALATARGAAAPGHGDVPWAGSTDAAVARLHTLRTEWLAALERLGPDELAEPAGAWPTVAHLVAWVNMELMKNVAEIGQLRLARRASLA
ncbi:DinB family protein [Nocardia sp. NPDC057353]|uniref:DinB family protein n=1 Tax=Nocardia sp. NPDC057353 TaxID=3346104 RepID=UPI003635721E